MNYETEYLSSFVYFKIRVTLQKWKTAGGERAAQ
jgi:hypothetical protein